MKHSFIIFISLAAVAAALVSCAKESDIKNANETSKGKAITINVLAGDDTRTYVEDGDVPVVKWSESDAVTLFEIMDGAVAGYAASNAATLEEGKASFNTTLDWEAEGGSSYQYSAVYPKSAVYDFGDGYYVLYLPENQILEGNNLALNSDILFSTVVDNGATRVADGEDIRFSFRRLGTVVRLTLKGIGSGEKIRQVKLTAPAKVAGTIAYDPVTSTVDPKSAFADYSTNVITLSVDDLTATGSDVVWFRVLPERDWGEDGDQLTIEVATDKNVYKKVIASCPTMKFVDGGLTKFGVNLASSVVEPLPVPYLEDFENGADDWTLLDEDGDGYTWDVVSAMPNSGDYALSSQSYINNYGPLEPDNWAFTPLVQLTTDNYLSFWVRAVDTNYPYEHYAVYIAEGSPLGDAEVLMAETEFPNGEFVDLGEDGVYQRYVLQIPKKYENKAVCIGFRHFNCTDMYWFNLDDVEITEGKPAMGIDAKYEDYLGEWASGAKCYTIAEKVNGVSYTISGLTGQGEYEVEALFENGRLVLYEQTVFSSGTTDVCLQGSSGYFPSYPDGSKVTIFRAEYDAEGNQLNIVAGNTYYMFITYENQTRSKYEYDSIPTALVPYVPDTTTYIFKEDFESEISGWTFIDSDGDGYGWSRMAGLKTYSGSYALASQSYDNTAGALTPDNWAFTPAVTLTSNNYVSFWVRAQDPSWGSEHYAVYITDQTPSEKGLSTCTVLLSEQVYPNGDPVEVDADGYYQRYVIKIPSKFDGKDVYVGFRHFNCTDMFILNIDDVAVSEGSPVTSGSKAAPAVRKAPKAHAPIFQREGTSTREKLVSRDFLR